MTEIGRGLPAGSDLVPGWLVRLAAIGWRLLATIAPRAGPPVHRARAVDRHGLDPGRCDRGGDIRSLRPRTAEPRLVADQGSGRRLPRRRAGHHRDPRHHRARLPALCRAIPRCAEHRRRDAPGEAGRPVDPARRSGSRSNGSSTGIEGWFAASAHGVAADVGTVATVAILGTFLTFFFMMDGDKAWVWALSSANTWRRDAITTSGHVALERVGGYLRGTAIIAAFDGARGGTLPGPPRRAAGRPARGHRVLRPVHPVHRRAW